MASDGILKVWRKFDRFPMETLTKVWYFQKDTARKQREVSLMKEHYQQYGITGNCFDLALWLLHEFDQDGIEAYPVGHDLGTPHAHVAVIAMSEEGHRYFCDLGDQWLNPVLIDSESKNYRSDRLQGFFPAAEIQVNSEGSLLTVEYHRPNGKVSSQDFHTTPVAIPDFLKAAEISQNTIKDKPLLECRVPRGDEIAHWEFYNWNSVLSTTQGLFHETAAENLEQWCTRIHQRTGYDQQVLLEALHIYDSMR
ncbi:hypothetical protein SAMN05216378_0511 [Paenibacillus catalpae]|uniref:Arylamine N-acetyltransferase n=2 Tax=Paenibacillus catalpae TaxID=1045775 RepID=A0A1I1THL3_9BACL|nr:hypothetical protein SAMN05216378_0511 [Paenibacillus catalpae]